jgi:thiamine pyrophosphokinase
LEHIKKCTFGSIKFDALVCLKGNIPDYGFFSLFPEIPVYAADGAADLLLQINIVPDFIIGDLDSFSFQQTDSKTQIIREPDQETNDFEKILHFAGSRNLQNLLIIGFHGGDLEHTLNNWSVFVKFADKLNLCIYDNDRYGIPLLNSAGIATSPGEIISLIPQPACRLSTKNLKWELNDEILELGKREGARNVALANNVIIEIHYGGLLLFVNKRLPFAPVFE